MRDAFYLPQKYSCGRFFSIIKCPYVRKFKDLHNQNNAQLVDFHNLYQLLHSEVYQNGLRLQIFTLKSVLINEGESNRKLPKMFASKKLVVWFVKNRCVRGGSTRNQFIMALGSTYCSMRQNPFIYISNVHLPQSNRSMIY